MAANNDAQGGFAARFPKAAYWIARAPFVNLFYYLLTAPSDLDNFLEQVATDVLPPPPPPRSRGRGRRQLSAPLGTARRRVVTSSLAFF